MKKLIIYYSLPWTEDGNPDFNNSIWKYGFIAQELEQTFTKFGVTTPVLFPKPLRYVECEV